MIRTQIQLTKKQAERVKRMTSRSSTSMAEVIRRALDQYLGNKAGDSNEKKRARASAVAGLFSSGDENLSRDHDDAFSAASGGTKN